jgi:N-alpha-acetyltransferase 50
MLMNVENKIWLDDVNQHNVHNLRLLNSVLFPMKYDQKFYNEVLQAGEFAKLVYYGDGGVEDQNVPILVGAVCCRREYLQNGDSTVIRKSFHVVPQPRQTINFPDGQITGSTVFSYRLYIMTLGVLAPYRRLGIGSMLLRHILNESIQESTIRDIYLHVQINNNEALRFYEKFGFQITSLVPHYYRTIKPSAAYELCKQIHHDDSTTN